MEITINYLAVLSCGILSLIIGSIWYGPLFGKLWAKVIGADECDLEKRKEMQRKAMPLYFIQLILVLFQVLVLAHLIADTQTVSGLSRSLWIWGAFIVPTIAGTSMWNNDSRKTAWTRFFIQSGYQLVIFFLFGIVLTFWK